MRCASCGKFVPNGELEFQSPDVDIADNVLHVEVEVMIPCGECGGDLASGQLEAEVEIKHECSASESDDGGFVVLDAGEPDANDRFEGKGRGQRHYYGFDLVTKIQCLACQEELDISSYGETMASSFEPCN
jgi:hypothetical protein